jgi:hypothetical protein
LYQREIIENIENVDNGLAFFVFTITFFTPCPTISTMSEHEIPFNIGYKIGEMTRQVEVSIEFVKNSSKQRPILKVAQIYESLKYVYQELELMNIPNEILQEIEEYLDWISGGKYSEEKLATDEKSEEMILGRIKKSLKKLNQNLNRDMKIDDMKSLLRKLQIWRDRVSNAFSRMKIS